MRGTMRLLLGALVFAGALSRLYSFTFEPISRDFAPRGRNSIQTFKLVNAAAETVVVRIRILTREIDEEGRETNEPADHLFVVYPARAVLAPQSIQAVKVQWKGPAELSSELCYRILVEQLPVSFNEEPKAGGTIRVMFRYLGALYILPKGARPEVVLDSCSPAVDAQGRAGLQLVFANRGNAHTLLNELEITVTGKGNGTEAELVFEPEMLQGINGENLLPGARRRHFLPLPPGFPKDDLDVAFRFESVR